MKREKVTVVSVLGVLIEARTVAALELGVSRGVLEKKWLCAATVYQLCEDKRENYPWAMVPT